MINGPIFKRFIFFIFPYWHCMGRKKEPEKITKNNKNKYGANEKNNKQKAILKANSNLLLFFRFSILWHRTKYISNIYISYREKCGNTKRVALGQ